MKTQGFLTVGFVLLISVLPDGGSGNIGCRDNANNPVDWFIICKLPKLSESSAELVQEGVGQAYMDVNTQKWTLLNRGINDSDHPVFNTLQQIYKHTNSESIAYLLYNDEVPGGSVSHTHGHTKGDIAFDKTSGFWLIHSVPKFPPLSSKSYEYPESGKVYGQSFLCITLSYKFFNNIGQQLMYNYPQIYDFNLPPAFMKENPFIADVVNGTHVKSAPWNNTCNLTSSGGRQFISFSKFSSFGKDIYHDWVAPYFKSDLLAETWQNGGGKMSSDCSQYKVFNVVSVKLLNETFKESEDHSKWAITTFNSVNQKKESAKWICIGDINRMKSQMYRAGGTVCSSSLANVWENFETAVADTEQCNRIKTWLPVSHHARL